MLGLRQPNVPAKLRLREPSSAPEISHKPSKTKPYTPCPSSKKKVIAKCGVIIEPEPVKRGSRWALPEGGPLLEGSGVKGGWSAADLQSAYNIPTSGGETQTVAVVLAYGDETAESDLAEYRKQYGLEPCTKANGCFKKVNQSGEEKNYPEPNSGWAVETALDLEMVSAACPECNILLVEATTASIADLAAAVETAAKLGATEISNSYGAPERYSAICPKDKGCSEYNSAYVHPGIPVTVSAGDSSFDEEYYIVYGNAISGGPSWPAASPDVIAVGGTELEKAENARGWTEKVWAFSGSGCSLVGLKPSWQSDPNCSKRMGNDIAAVASNVSMYSTPGLGGWANVGGTSVSAPLVAGIEAHASKAVREEGAEAFYRRKLNDVTAGINGTCRHEYPCEAGEGYDGPTGWGTPNGPFEETVTFAATTGEVSNRAADGAKLIGAVYPQGAETTYYFEYGPTTAYGMSTKSASAGSGTLWKSVSQTVSGLPEGTYHYRLAAVRESKTIYGSDQTFQTSPWSVQTTSNEGEGLNPLTSVSCTSTTTCMAVGWHTYFEGEEHHGWSQRWDGSKWTNQKTASVIGSSLNSVSCTASNACTAVGSKGTPNAAPHAERWNGSTWSAQTVPAPNYFEEEVTPNAELSSVSCTSATSCVAVGWYEHKYSEGTGGVLESALPFSATWNGTEWQLKSVPIPAEAVFGSLNEVSCTSATACIAVGSYYLKYKAGFTEYRSLAETWNGTEWTIQSMPKPEDSETKLYWLGLSCLSASNCIAVGSYEKSSDKYYFHALGAHWDGSSWTLQSMPAQPEKDELHLEDVSCSTATTCLAVGFAYRSTPLGYRLRSLGMNWNGEKWSVQEMAPVTYNSVGMERPSDLLGVSCVSLNCETVGEMGNFGWSWSLAMGSTQTAPGAPKVTTEAASSTNTTEPVLNASVNANGYDTKYYFEYDTKEYKTGDGSHGSSVPVPAKEIGSYTWDQHVSEKIKGLKQKTTYHFRIVAENGLGVSRGSDQSFTTISAKASTEAATLVTAAEATLKGTVNPEGVETSYQFEYGTTTSYGQLAPAEAKSAGKGIADVKVSQIVSGLKPATTYHFRLAASNADIGTIYGSDQAFTTGTKLHWFACTKQAGGRYTNSKCATDGSPNEWESLKLKEAEKTSVKATGNPLAVTATIGGVKGTLNCETEVTNASLENPSGGGNGLGNAELKLKGCKAESGWSACKVTPGSAVAGKLELSTQEGKTYALLSPKEGTTLASFTFAECGGLSGSYTLTGYARGLYSNANTKIEFDAETTAEGLQVNGVLKATAVGSVKLETTVGGYILAQGAPVAKTEAASSVKPTEATLNGTVNPEGAGAHYQFEYGKTTSYGQLAPAEAKDAGEGLTDVKVAETIKGLVAGTVYHFRLAATNGTTTSYGADKTFTTAANPLRWFACTKQGGGKYKDGKCATEGSPNEWEAVLLKEGVKTTITAKGNPLAITASIAGVKGTLNCETEVTNASLENPSGGGAGLGNAELKLKGCKTESGWSTCKVTPGSAVAEKLELSTTEGKAYASLSPKTGTSLGSFTFAECGGLSGSYELNGYVRGLYSNANSKIEFTTETTAEGLKVNAYKATAVGSIGLETTAGGYIRVE